MKISKDKNCEGRLFNGFDDKNKAWVLEGEYVRCGHPENMNCECYGRIHEGEKTKKD